jgi:general secretion pathway protein D
MTFGGGGSGAPNGFDATFPWTTLDDTQLDVILRATQQRERGTVLAAPRLTLFSGQQATVDVGEEVPYAGEGTAPATRPAEGLPAITVLPDGYLFLEIQPAVSSDRRFVTMTLKPTVALIPLRLDLGDVPKGETQQRPAQTQVILRDDQTVVLGGLTRKPEEVQEKIPALGDIPLLGRLFTSRGERRKKTELLILVTPTVTLEQE